MWLSWPIGSQWSSPSWEFEFEFWVPQYPLSDVHMAAEELPALALSLNFSKGKVTDPIRACHRPDLANNRTTAHSFEVHSKLKNLTAASRRDYSIVLLIMPPIFKSSLYLLGTLLTPSRPRELLRSNSSKEEVNCCVTHRLLLTSEIIIWYLHSFFYQKIWNLPRKVKWCVQKRSRITESEWMRKISHLLKASQWVMMSACERVTAFFGRMPRTRLQSLHVPAGITSHSRTRKFGPSWGTTSTAGTGCVFTPSCERSWTPTPHHTRQPLPFECPCTKKRICVETGLSCDNLH